MKSKIINIFWGIVFILVSGLLLAEVLGYVSFDSLTSQAKAVIFGAAGAAFFVTYFLDGVRKWGWLFPALLSAVLAYSALSPRGMHNLLTLGWPLLAALAIPLYAGFIVDRRHWILLIIAYGLSVVAFINLGGDLLMGPRGVTGAQRLPLFEMFLSTGPLFLFALPFFVLYFRSRTAWWAVIPGGVLVSLGLSIVESILFPSGRNPSLAGIPNAVLLLGFALTMAMLWLRRAIHPTGWAKYPAAGFLVLAIAAFILGRGWQTLSLDMKALIFAAGAALFFLAYFLHGLRKWGWLFPALACTGMAATIWMEDLGMEGSISAVPLFAGLTLPFVAGFAMDRKRPGLLILAAFLAAFTAFLGIPESFQAEWSGVLFFGLFALPFIAAYFLLKHAWWALVSAGTLASFALVVLLETLVPHQSYPALPGQISWGVFIWVLLLGLAATFGAAWLHRKTQPTAWAKYPAAALLSVAVLALVLGEHFQDLWLAAVALVVGVIFLLALLDRKHLPSGGQVPGAGASVRPVK